MKDIEILVSVQEISLFFRASMMPEKTLGTKPVWSVISIFPVPPLTPPLTLLTEREEDEFDGEELNVVLSARSPNKEYVFPVPVCPYAKQVAETPLKIFSIISFPIAR